MLLRHKMLRYGVQFAAVVLAAAVLGSSAFAQVADGNLVGSILDPTGAAVPNAAVEAKNLATGVKSTVKADSKGEYRLNNLLVGDYTVSASAEGFAPAAKKVTVELNKTATLNIGVALGTATTIVEVTDEGPLLDTTTAQIANTYPAVVAAELPAASNPAGGVINEALLGAGVASSGGIGAGTGPSVGGQRPRNNNFTIEGTDNNRKDVTGPVATVPNDSVQEFTVLQNQFGPEFGHSSGGQFNTILKSGSNAIHGLAYEYLQNRHLNSLDQSFARNGATSVPRYDSSILGGQVGGPIVHDKLFYFGDFEYNPAGAAVTSSAVSAPTSAGYASLATVPGVSQTNFNVLQQNLGSAPQQNGTVTVTGSDSIAHTIPVGNVPIISPAWQNTYRWLLTSDYSISDRDQLRGRLVSNSSSRIDSTAVMPSFWGQRETSAKAASLSEIHTINPNLSNELRLAYNRFSDNIPGTNAQFPGLDAFPNLIIYELVTQIGPDPNAPQKTWQNVYQLADNVTWIKGRHDFTFGVERRNTTSELTFVSNGRGDYEYLSLQQYILDRSPDFAAKRTVGSALPYSGNSYAFSAFGNDEWKVTRNLTLSIGVRYELNGVARSMKDFALNSLADVPGVLTFFAPQPQTNNFAPRLGFAYSPGRSATTSIRGGFGMGYDQIFDNVGNNTRPPQASTAIQLPAAQNAPNFLAGGGLLPIPPPLTPAAARTATTGWLDNQKLGYAINWSFGIQHKFGKDYVLDVRYLGSRGVHLLLQSQLNRIATVTAANALPTFLTTPDAATLAGLTTNLTQLKAINNNPLAAYGFGNTITTYGPQGKSIYHGLAVDFNKRLSSHNLLKASYTWSHLMDNSTMEINFTSLSPRRPQDFGNLGPEWASSALDRRHRATITWLYTAPWFEHNHNWFLHNLIGNYQISGTYTIESPEYVTPQSVTDTNLNGDSATDRVIINPNGVPGTGSGVTALKVGGQTVGYVAKNPNAEYIVAAQGAYANSGRNILPAAGINNVDFNVMKSFTLGETRRLEFRADFYNGLNHPQYTPGNINNVLSTGSTHVGETVTLLPSNALFGQWNQVYSSNPRVIQAVAKFVF